jgi:hypothetical protein
MPEDTYSGLERRSGEHCSNHETNTKDISAMKGSINTIKWIGGGLLTLGIYIISNYMGTIESSLKEIKADGKETMIAVNQIQRQTDVLQQRINYIEMQNKDIHFSVSPNRNNASVGR